MNTTAAHVDTVEEISLDGVPGYDGEVCCSLGYSIGETVAIFWRLERETSDRVSCDMPLSAVLARLN
jgi:hypothetical protein